MSEFDKEAERERLREKYEREEAKREVTEKMSELLLQGATMTNAHCSECGDPIFRYDGQEFCATCEKAVDRGTDESENEAGGNETADGTGDDAATPDDAPAGDRIEVASPSENSRVQFGSGDAADDGGDRSETAREDDTDPVDADAQSRQPHTVRGHRGPSNRSGERPDRSETRPHRTAGPDAPSTPAGSDLAETRAALQQTLRRLAQAAQSCEDPREAEAYLSAAHEAAETLATLRR